MKFQPKVSICIPTYNQPIFVERLLQSIKEQSYRNIEVIISDDSNNKDIQNVFMQFESLLNIQYYHHEQALKTPKNWNFALDKATGDLIMLVHQDDWLSNIHSIEQYVYSAVENPTVDFFFSKNTPRLMDGSIVNITTNYNYIEKLEQNPYRLVKNYVVGPPSNIMVRKCVNTRYDERMIWLVDVDYCVRTIENGHHVMYIDKELINIGMHPEQTTVFCDNNPQIVLRENIQYSAKIPNKAFKDIQLYDYFWRLLRNHHVQNLDKIYNVGINMEDVSPLIKSMIKWQSKITSKLLNIGLISKFIMFIHYITHSSQRS